MTTIAILGWDNELPELVRALGSVEVAGVFDPPESAHAAIAQWLPDVPVHSSWESLLAAGATVVLVGRQRTAAQADDQLRKLVQDGARLLLIHPPCEAILALELEMIRRDTGAPLEVYYPGCRHPLADALVDATARSDFESSLGGLEQIVVQRHRVDRSAEAVFSQLARDVHWLNSLTGDIHKVSALGGGQDPTDAASLNVQLTADNGLLVRWNMQPALDGSVDSFTFVGSGGSLAVRMPRDSLQWQLVRSGGADPIAGPDARAELVSLVQSLAAAATGREAAASARTSWPIAVRSMEVVDQATVSLRRGRTIDLPKTQVSEEKTFKGMMAAAGCLIVLLAPMLLVSAAIIDRIVLSFRNRQASSELAPQTDAATSHDSSNVDSNGLPAAAAPPPSRRIPWFAIAVAAPLVVFLLLQSLQLVFHSGAGPPSNSP